MITKCIAGFGLTAGIVGLMAFSPLQEDPPQVTAPAPVEIVTSVPEVVAVTVAPKSDEVTVVSKLLSSIQAKPRRVSGEMRQKIRKIKRGLAELKEVYENSDSSYEKNEIKDRMIELKEVLISITENAPPASRLSRTSGNGGASEIRKKLSAARRKIAELHEQGRHEEADAIRKRAEQAVSRAEKAIAERRTRGQMRPRRAERQSPPEPGRPQRAERAPRPKRADRPEPGPRSRRASGPNRQGVPDSDLQLHEMMNRIEHMMRAAENLEAAGMMEQAHDIRTHAHQMEQKARTEMEKRQQQQRSQQQRQAMIGRGPGGGDHNLAREVDELRREVQELREIVHQIHQKVEELSDDWN